MQFYHYEDARRILKNLDESSRSVHTKEIAIGFFKRCTISFFSEKNRAKEDGNEGIGLAQLDIHQEDFRNEYSFGNDVGRVQASSRGLILFAAVMLTQVLLGQDLGYC